MTDRLAVARQPCRPVRQVAEVLLLTDREAEVRAWVAAVLALAALRREERDDVVADGDRGDALPHRLDNPGTLVPEHGRRVPGGVCPRRREQVGVANPAGREADEHLASLRLGEVELLNLERLTEPLEHRGTDLHGAILRKKKQAATRTARFGARQSALPLNL
jgi:hypothetical protein